MFENSISNFSVYNFGKIVYHVEIIVITNEISFAIRRIISCCTNFLYYSNELRVMLLEYNNSYTHVDVIRN